MKRYLFYGSLAAFGLISLASCSSEEDMPAPSGDGVTFTLRIPGNITTRGTFGDGADDGDRAILDNLQWTVFEVSADGSTLTKVFSDAKAGAFASNQNEETVTIKLAKGKKYQVAFYADDADNNFVTYTDGNINVDYANAASNTAAEDAFIGKSDIFTVEGAFTKTITLTRPFAQLNWGTDDLTEKSIVTLIPTLTGTVKVTQGLYTKMNVISGEVDAASAVSNPVEFAAVRFNNRPPQTFPVTKEDASAQPYELIAMNYLLTGNGTIDCELAFNNGLSPVTVSAASVKVNYRTNIYGSLLTSPGTFKILIDNSFPGDNNIIYPLPDGAARVNGQIFDNINDALAAADGAPIELAASTYDSNSIQWPASGTVKLIGAGSNKTIISNLDFENVTFSHIEFSNLALNPTENQYNHTACGFRNIKTAKYTNVAFNGEYHAYASVKEEFDNCIFNYNAKTDPHNAGRYNMYYETPVNVILTNCKFNNVLDRGLLVYNSNAADIHERNLTITDCTFTAEATQAGKTRGAIEIHTENFNGVGGNIIISNSSCTPTFLKGICYEINNSTKVETTLFTITNN